ncbi:MAG: hypothetical protein HYX71_09045 [Opitutae bacterium]|nr:hypothetical protein [Opitutae bacterium]
MSELIKSCYDKLLAAFGAALVAAGGGWMWSHQADLARLRHQPVAAELSGAPYAVSGLQPPETKVAPWPKPAAQSHGGGWLYEVFTPPVIYYNALAKSFAVTPPRNLADGGVPFGLELLDVKFEPYRLQLVGYFGEPGDYLAAFVSADQPETLLARSGRRFEQLGLTLKSFDVKKVEVPHTDPWPVYDVAALAVLFDEKSGAEVVLDSRARKLTDTPLAVLRLTAAGAAPRALHEGDTFSDATGTYRVERIQVDPPEVVVARQTPGLPVPETRILRPAGKDGVQVAGKPAPPKKFPAPPKSGLATNGP